VSKKEENMINIEKTSPKYKINTCKYKIQDNILHSLNNIPQDNKEYNYIVPCSYDNIEDEYHKLNLKTKSKIFFIDNCDNIVAKDYLWKNLVNKYGIEKSIQFVPNTYVLKDKDKKDIKRLLNDYNKSKIYIMKKNIQRQEGLKITNSIDEILNNKGEYVLAQELLQNCYTINKRKINLRVYVLVVCHKNNIDVWVYNDGFMYYTPSEFRNGSTKDEHNITTGYIDRKIYDANPLTHQDFKKYLDNHNRELNNKEKELKFNGTKISEYLFNKIYLLISNVFRAFEGKICIKQELKEHYTFQLFGIDVGVNDNLEPQIMEINKGPDLGAKDERDNKLKRDMILNVHKVMNILNDEILTSHSQTQLSNVVENTAPYYEKHNFINVLEI
jgi:hypothetical protein